MQLAEGSAACDEEQSADAPLGGSTEELSASSLKALGNEAYQQGDLQAAVDYWNKAIRRHVEAMQEGGGGPPILGKESLELERSIYLNLAQGYLKLGEPARALRACQAVLHENRDDTKARYRAASACLQLRRHEEAEAILSSLLQVEPTHAEAATLLRQVRAARRAEAKQQKELAQRMCAGAGSFSEGREEEAAQAAAQRSALGRLGDIDPEAVARGTNIADAAARAAREREARRQAVPVTTSAADTGPVNPDFDAFRQKAMARSRAYAADAARSRKRTEDARRGLRLDWLRAGNDAGGFDDFVQPLQQELDLEVAARAAAEADEEADEEHGQPGGEHGSADHSGADSGIQNVHVKIMDEMD